MSVAWARSSARHAPIPRPSGSSFATSRSASPARSVSQGTCMCNQIGVGCLHAQLYHRRYLKERTVVAELLPAIDPATAARFGTAPDESRVNRAAAALEGNGISVLRAANAAEAKRVVLDLIPDGSEVNHGASNSLDVAGITEEIDHSGRYEAIRPRTWSMDRQTQADEIRRLNSGPGVMLGSVHAVTETGSLMAASMGGSQLGPYVSGAGRVILVVGTQKIVPDLEEGLRRINEYAFPLEDARAQAAYGIHSAVNKVLIINREITPGRIMVVFVDEVLGF